MITRWIEYGAWPLAALGVALAGLRVVRALRPSRPGLCPGRPVSLWRVLDPFFWIMAKGCWYELQGAVPDSQGYVRCPECNTRQRPTARRRRAFRWHTGRLALMLLLAALCCQKVRWTRGGQWAPLTPAPVLIAVHALAPGFAKTPVQDELLARLGSGSISPWLQGWLDRQAIRALAADELTYNAEWGQAILQHHPRESIAVLEEALQSKDYQQRQIAAHILRGIEPRPASGSLPPDASTPGMDLPSDRVLKVCVEGLGDDSRFTQGTRITNAMDSREFLCLHAQRAAPFLALAIGGWDDQRSLLAASIAIDGKVASLQDSAAQVLVGHLSDNEVDSDAIVSASVLIGMGPAAIPYLEPLLPTDSFDPFETQAAATAELIIRRVRGEKLSAADAKRLNVISIRNLGAMNFADISQLRIR